MQLVPCVHCKRHVGVAETTCPFCAAMLPVQRPQLAFARRLTRAAIFSAAAVVACDGKEQPKPAPAPSPAAPSQPADAAGLDAAGLDAHAPVAASHAADAQLADAGVPDAATPDAGISPENKERKRKQLEDAWRRRDLERRKNALPNNKPYGAPPARRRIV